MLQTVEWRYYLKFSETNAKILGLKDDIDSAPKLLVLLYLRSRTWPLLRFWIGLSQNLKFSVIIVGDAHLRLKILSIEDS